MNLTVHFEYFKSTKGTHVYQEIVEPGAEPTIPTLYIRKAAFAGAQPAPTLTVTILSAA